MRRIGDLVVPKVEQVRPRDNERISYIEIGSISSRKEIVDTASLMGAHAPSRARQRVRAGDVLVSMTRPNLNAVAIVPTRLNGAIASTGFDVLRAKDDDLVPEWLFYRVQTQDFVDDMCKRLQGVVYPAIRPADVRDHLLPLPTPLVQRQAVVAIDTHFSRLDAAVASLRRAKANVERARASVLQAAVTGRLVATEAVLARAKGRDYEPAWALLACLLAERQAAGSTSGVRGKYNEAVAHATEGLPELPEGWCWASMDQLVQVDRPICYGVLKAGEHVEGGIPLVRVTDITSGDLSIRRLKRCSPDRESKFARARLRPGDLVVSKDGTIGQAMIVPPNLLDANVTQHVLRVAPNNAIANRYMMHALHSSRAQSWMKGETRGVALQGINVEDFRMLALPLPPLAEQHRIVTEVDRQLSVLTALDTTLDANFARCTRLRQAILHRAFSGRLVPAAADSNDEVAEAVAEPVAPLEASR